MSVKTEREKRQSGRRVGSVLISKMDRAFRTIKDARAHDGERAIFSLTTGGAYSSLYSFAAPAGDGGYSTPIQHTDGEFYRMMTRGVASGDGVVYGYGLESFRALVTNRGKVGDTVGILGRGFADSVSG